MKWLLCIWLLLPMGTTFAQQPIADLLKHSVYAHTSTGLSVRDMSTGKETYAVDSDKLLSPASSLKLLTTFVGIATLGADFTFETTLAYTGSLSSDGTLDGDVFIIGGGDPTLGSDRLAGSLSTDGLIKDIVSRFKKGGITCIDGNVIVSTSTYGEQAVPDQWNYNDIGNYYASGAWGININENIYKVHFKGGRRVGSSAKVQKIDPNTQQLHVQSLVTTAGATTGDQAYIYGIPRQPHKVIRGTIPATKGVFTIKGALPNPPLVLAELVQEGLHSAGIVTQGRYREGLAKQKLTAVHTYRSPPLATLVTEANRHSINLYCEAILKELGKQKGANGSISEGIRVVYDYLKKNNLPADELILKDGSGLAGENKITPSLMTAFLLHAQKGLGSKVLTYVPQVGKEGTVRNLLKGSSATTHYYLKSGSFEGVQSFTGYVKAKSGKSYSICLIVNNYTVSYRVLKPQLEKLLQTIYAEG